MEMKISRKILSVIIILSMTTTIAFTPISNDANTVQAAAKKSKAYKVVRVVDGDTIVISKGGEKVKVRLIGVDTPESVHPDAGKNVEYGKIATKFTKKKVSGKKVKLEYDKDKKDQYGRTLAYVYYGKKYDSMLNKALLKKGHAKAKYYSPNGKYKTTFEKLQKTAKSKKLGLWKYESGSGSSGDTSSGSGSYVGASTTYKFHKSSCSYVKNIKSGNRVYFKKRSEAVNAGYVPCKVCAP